MPLSLNVAQAKNLRTILRNPESVLARVIGELPVTGHKRGSGPRRGLRGESGGCTSTNSSLEHPSEFFPSSPPRKNQSDRRGACARRLSFRRPPSSYVHTCSCSEFRPSPHQRPLGDSECGRPHHGQAQNQAWEWVIFLRAIPVQGHHHHDADKHDHQQVGMCKAHRAADVLLDAGIPA